jgi:hypothetical protein
MCASEIVVVPLAGGYPLDVHSLLSQIASERNLRQSTVYAYQGFFKRLRIEEESLTKEELESRLLSMDNISSSMCLLPGRNAMTCLTKTPCAWR